MIIQKKYHWTGSASRITLLMVTLGVTVGMLTGKFPVDNYNVLATMVFAFYFGQKSITQKP